MDLIIERGANQGQRFSVTQTHFTIGRDGQCDVVLHDERVSHCHAEIWWQDGAWIVRDRQSVNGTWVNRQQLQGPYRLQPGDQLGLGRTIISFAGMDAHLAHAGAPAASPDGFAGDNRNALATALTGLTASGALLLVGGALMDWLSIAVFFVKESIRGVDSVVGQAAFVGGLLSLLLALSALWLRYTLRHGKQSQQNTSYLRWIPWGQLGVVAVILALAAIELVKYNEGSQTPVLFGLTVRDLVTLTVEPGVFIAGTGLALLLLGAGGQVVIRMLTRRR